MNLTRVAVALAAVTVLGTTAINVVQQYAINDIEDRLDEPSTYFQAGAPVWAWDPVDGEFRCVEACAENGIGEDDTLTRDEVYPIDGAGDE